MVDKVTKKRLRINYKYLIEVLGLYGEYVKYCRSIRPLISKRRMQLNFLRTKKVLIPELYYFCKWFNVYDYADLIIKSNNREADFYGM